MAAAFVSRIFYGKLEMTIVMNATLAGGVAIGTPSDLITSPGGALWVGTIAGILSAISFNNVGPWLATKINLQDTCGVFSLHGMPGILGGIVSAVVIAGASNKSFHTGYFPAMSATDDFSAQVMAQIYALLITLGLAIFTGLIGGKIAGLELLNPPKVLFKDDDHFHDVADRYPEEYKELK